MKRFFSTEQAPPERHWRPLMWVLLPVLALFGLVAGAPMAVKLEEATGLNWLFSWRGPRAAPEQVAIAAVNSRAAEALSLPLPSQWPRSIYAEVVDRLHQAGAQAIVFDIAFRGSRSAAEDAALAEAITRAGNVVLFKYLKRQQIDTGHGLLDIEEAITPPAEILRGAAAIGSFTLPQYAEQIFRARLYRQVAEGYEATQPLLAFLLSHPQATEKLYRHLKREAGESVAALPDLQTIGAFFYQQFAQHAKLGHQLLRHPRLSQDGDVAGLVYALSAAMQPVHINYYGANGALSLLEVNRLLQSTPEALHERFADKVVYIGYSDHSQTEQRDSHTTAFTRNTGVDLSGVEISATILCNLLDRSLILGPQRELWIGAVAGAVLLACFSVWYLRFRQALLVQTTAAAAYATGAMYLFAQNSLWLPLALPLAAAASGNLLTFGALYRRGRIREAAVVNSLRHYLPEEAANQLGASVAGIEQRHRVVYGVCLMTDIVGYSRLSEQCEPAELHQLMNRYYAVLIEEVKNHGGMVANIVGDSLLALWVGSEINEDLCRRACLAALNINDRVEALEEFCARLPTCYALHGGEFSLGNLGAAGHFEYSPVGDIINTIARIEKLNRKLGTRRLMSAVVEQHLPEELRASLFVQPLGEFELHKKSRPIELCSFEYRGEED